MNIRTLKKGLENQETFLLRANPLVFNLMMFNFRDDPATVAGWDRASLFATHHRHAAEAKSNTVDRDLNASRNILAEGLRLVAAGQTETLNARGEPVSLPTGSTAR